MTHDPLCPAPLCDYTGRPGSQCMGYEDCWHDCQCNLIARVREDERENDGGRVMSAYTLGERNGYNAALRDAARAVELKTWISVYELSDESKGYNKGIRAAIAAIEALGGEQ